MDRECNKGREGGREGEYRKGGREEEKENGIKGREGWREEGSEGK